MLRSWAAVAYFAVNAIILVWDLLIARRIVQAKRGSPFFLAVSALAALMVVPAVVVAIAAPSIQSGRVVHVIEWIWPLALLAALVQAGHALVRGTVAPSLGLSFTTMNAIALAAEVARVLTSRVVDAPDAVLALGAAHANAMGFALGRAALTSPLALQVPVFAPSFAARYKVGRPFRIVLGTWAAATVLLFVAEYPRAFHAVSTYRSLGAERLQERPGGDLAIGLGVLPIVRGVPAAVDLREDLALVRSLDASIISVVVEPVATTPRALDSLARAFVSLRRDSTLLVVALGYGSRDGRQYRRDADAYLAERVRAVETVVRRLRPDVLLPAHDPYTAGGRSLGDVPPRWWRGFLREAATRARSIDPRVRVGVMASAYTPPDSELYVWAASSSTALDVVGFSLRPSYGGGASLLARFHVAERWMRGTLKPHIVFATGAYPRLHGQRNQERALWGMLAWATRQPQIEAFLVDGAGDYGALAGLRAPGGRVRPAMQMLVRAKEALAERR